MSHRSLVTRVDSSWSGWTGWVSVGSLIFARRTTRLYRLSFLFNFVIHLSCSINVQMVQDYSGCYVSSSSLQEYILTLCWWCPSRRCFGIAHHLGNYLALCLVQLVVRIVSSTTGIRLPYRLSNPCCYVWISGCLVLVLLKQYSAVETYEVKALNCLVSKRLDGWEAKFSLTCLS